MSKNKTESDLHNEEEDTDSNDEDYVPNEKDSESEKSNHNTDDESEDDEGLGKKSKRKASCLEEQSDEEKQEIVKKIDPKKGDELWSSFLKDVNTVQNKPQENKYTDCSVEQKPAKQETVKKDQTDVVKKPEIKPLAKPSGLAGILDKIGKKPKINLLEKSRQDWNEFKKVEQIDEDLAIQNKGKSSYLERKAFLERTDYRQFEIEKDLRNKERSQRNVPKS